MCLLDFCKGDDSYWLNCEDDGLLSFNCWTNCSLHIFININLKLSPPPPIGCMFNNTIFHPHFIWTARISQPAGKFHVCPKWIFPKTSSQNCKRFFFFFWVLTISSWVPKGFPSSSQSVSQHVPNSTTLSSHMLCSKFLFNYIHGPQGLGFRATVYFYLESRDFYLG